MSDELFDMSDDELEAAFKAAKTEDLEASDAGTSTDDVDISDDSDFDNASDTDDETDVDDSESGEETEDDTEDEQSDEESDEEEQEGEDSGDSDIEEDTEEDTDTGTEKENLTTKPLVFKAVGKEYTISEEEMREQFPKVFAQAMDYTRKMQSIAPWRKTIDAIENAKLGHNDVNLMIDVLKGDKGAIAEVLKRTGVDSLDVDPETEIYSPKEYGRDEKALEMEDVIDSIKGDDEYRVTHSILTKGWDLASWKEFEDNPNKIAQLHQDVKSGIYTILQQEADKLKVYDGAKRRDLDYYLEAARQYYSQEVTNITRNREQELAAREKQLDSQNKIAEIQAKSSKREADKQAAGKRRAAAPTGRTTQKKKGVTDYMDISEEEFEDWYKRLEERM